MSPASSIENLNISLFHDARLDRSFMVMVGYFDESGTHAGSPIVTVAGFIASAEQWGDYERELGALNAEYGVSLFHAKDIRQGKGAFKGWPPRRRAQYHSRFLKLADDHLAYGLAMILPCADFASIYKATPFPPKARPDTAYGMCVRMAILKAIVLLRDKTDDWPLNVVVEDGNNNLGDAIKVFREIRDGLTARYADVLGYFSFNSKKNCLPLAIADSLAYAIFRATAGYTAHPTDPKNAVVAGAAEPPIYVSKFPMSRTVIDENALALFRDDLLATRARLPFVPQ